MPDGAAAKDGRLQTGDALMRVNGLSVMSMSHQDVVSMFQALPLGDFVELEVVRGYALPFDPDDPNVETIGSYTVVQRRPSVGSESPVPRSSEDNSPTYPSFPPPPPPMTQGQGAMDNWATAPGIFPVSLLLIMTFTLQGSKLQQTQIHVSPKITTNSLL